MRQLKAPSPAMAVALIALFVALGGTGYAAGNAILSSPTKAQIIKIVKSVAPSLRVSGLATLPSGKTETGLFTGGGSYNSAGVIGLTITYPRPLAAAILDTNIVEVRYPSTSTTHCAGVGHADPGYLCLYDYYNYVSGTDFHSNDGDNFPVSMGKFGVELRWSTTGPDAWVGGSWAVTAP